MIRRLYRFLAGTVFALPLIISAPASADLIGDDIDITITFFSTGIDEFSFTPSQTVVAGPEITPTFFGGAITSILDVGASGFRFEFTCGDVPFPECNFVTGFEIALGDLDWIGPVTGFITATTVTPEAATLLDGFAPAVDMIGVGGDSYTLAYDGLTGLIGSGDFTAVDVLFTVQHDSISVPEPASFALFGLGLLILLIWFRPWQLRAQGAPTEGA